MIQQEPSDPYIRSTIQYPDGHFVILCQLRDQSALFFESYEIQVDKTFSRTKCREFEVNSYDHASHRITTLARVFTDYESAEGYKECFTLVFNTAERDMGKPIRWGHLFSRDPNSPLPRIKSVIVDEHSGQIVGWGMYMEDRYQRGDRDWHIWKLIKVCRVHYQRTIRRLQTGGVPEGISWFSLFNF
jgi:hypothetical protein